MTSDMLRQYAESNPEIAASAVGGAVLLFIVLAIWIRYLTRTKHERSVKRVIKKIAYDHVKDVCLPDGTGDSVFINYLALTEKGILTVNLQNYPGILFGGEKVDAWTQVFSHKSYKFDNPLRYNELCLQAVRYASPKCPVLGRVVFTNAGEFPKGIPEGVSMIDQLATDMAFAPVTGEPPDALLNAWNVLKLSVSTPPKNRSFVHVS